MSWDRIIGQQRAIRLLRHAITSDRLGQSYLFAGPEGVGKDAVALEFAKVLNCERRRGATASCDECSSCRRSDQLQHPNIQLIVALPVGKGEEPGDPPLDKLSSTEIEAVREQMDLKAQNPYHDVSVPRATVIKVNSIRHLRRSEAFTSFEPGMKTFIVSDAELMNDEAANALLKTLEEPHRNTLIILTSAHPDRLLPTIVSRCQLVRFDYLSETDIEVFLRRHTETNEETAKLAARLANGSISRALTYADAALTELRAVAVDFIRAAVYRPAHEVVEKISVLADTDDKLVLERIIMLMQSWVRDALALSEGSGSILNKDLEEPLTKFVSAYPHTDYKGLLDTLDRAISLRSRNVYIPLLLTTLALDIRDAVTRRS